MGRPIKRQFLDFNVPSTTQGHLRTLVKKKKKIFFFKQTKRNTGKQERKIKEVKRALQSTKENRTQKWKSWVEHSLKKRRIKNI